VIVAGTKGLASWHRSPVIPSIRIRNAAMSRFYRIELRNDSYVNGRFNVENLSEA